MSYPEYESDVLRTLSLQFNLAGQNTGEGPKPARVAETLDRAIRLGEEVDALKRAIFYGSAYVDSAMTDLPDMPMHVGASPNDPHPTADMIHSAMGLFTEAAEFLSAVCASCFEATPFDTTNAVEELGDLEWYMAVMRQRLGVTQEAVQRANIAKLKARYPNKFVASDALERNLDRERSVLETASKVV